MRTHSLFTTISSFSKSEMKSFGKFVRSPYHNSNQNVIALYDKLVNHHPYFNKATLTYEKLHTKLFSGKIFRQWRMNELLNEMHSHAVNFLVQEELKNNPLQNHKLGISQFGRRQLDKDYEHSLSRMMKIISTSKYKDSDYYFNKFEAGELYREHFEYKKPLGKRLPFFEMMNSDTQKFVLFFITLFLKLHAVHSNQSKHIKYTPDRSFLREVMDYLEANPELLKENPYVNMLYKLALFEDNNSEEVFVECRLLLRENARKIEKSYLRLFYSNIYNFAKLRYIEHKEGYAEKCFEILNEMLEFKAYPVEGFYMSENSFINYVCTCLMMGKRDDAKAFIKKYFKQLNPEISGNSRLFAEAMILFDERNYNEVLSRLAKVKTKDSVYQLRLKKLQLRAMFELYTSKISENDCIVDDIYFAIDSFEKFLLREKKIPEFIFNRYKNFLCYLKRLCTLIENKDKDGLKILYDEIFLNKETENRDWFLEKSK